MGTLGALPALAVAPPQNPLEQFARVAQINSQIQEQQQRSQDMQIKRQQIQDQQATTAAMKSWDPSTGDYEGLAKSVLANGGSAAAATGIQQHGLDVKAKTADLTEKQRANFLANRKAVGDQVQTLTDPNTVPDAELPTKALNTVMSLTQQGLIGNAEGSGLANTIRNTQDPTQLRSLIDHYAKTQLGAAAVAAQQKEAAGTAESQAKTTESGAKTKEEQATTAKTQLETQMMQQYGTPQQQEARYVALQTKKNQGQPLSPEDTAFTKSFEHFKTLVPVANFNLQNAGAAADANGNPSQIAQALADNRMKWSEAVSPRTPQATKNAIMAQVYKINPNYDTSEFGLEADAAKKARSGAWADTRVAYNTAIDHADQLLAASNALKNGDVQKLNQLKNYFSTQFGSPETTNAQAIANAYNHEVTSVVAKGHMTDAEVAAGHGTLDVAKASPEQIAGVAQAYKNLMTSKRDELDKVIKAGAGGKANAILGVQSGTTPANDFFSQFGGKSRNQ